MSLRAIAVAEGKVELQRFAHAPLIPRWVRVKTLNSLISQGTELNTITGKTARFSKSWSDDVRLFGTGGDGPKTFPVNLGYSCVGRVDEVSPDVGEVAAGDIVWLDRPHQDEHVVPESEASFGLCRSDVDPRRYAFRVLTKVALAGVHDAQPYIGASAVVVGLGVVGQIVADLLQMAGVTELFGIDPSGLRRAHAARRQVLGIDPAKGDAALAIKSATQGRGVDFAIEASGSYDGLMDAIRSVCIGGRVITVSTYTGAPTLLNLGEEFHRNRIDLVSSMSINECPHRAAPLWDHRRLLLTARTLLDSGALCPERLITRVVPFTSLPDLYEELLNGRVEPMGILISYA